MNTSHSRIMVDVSYLKCYTFSLVTITINITLLNINCWNATRINVTFILNVDLPLALLHMQSQHEAHNRISEMSGQ